MGEETCRESRGDLSLVPGCVGITAMESVKKFKVSKDMLLKTACAVGGGSHRRKINHLPPGKSIYQKMF